jgi:PII-like signaling protein
MAIFLGKRHAVNGQPSVTLVDHREQVAGRLVYRAIGGAGDHVGEDFFNND